MDKFHIANVVKIYLIFQYYYQTLSIEAYAEDGRWECELADGGVSLSHIRNDTLLLNGNTHFGIGDNQPTGRQHESYKRSRK